MTVLYREVLGIYQFCNHILHSHYVQDRTDALQVNVNLELLHRMLDLTAPPADLAIAGAVKQDLVISAYKPNGGLEQRFELEAGAVTRTGEK